MRRLTPALGIALRIVVIAAPNFLPYRALVPLLRAALRPSHQIAPPKTAKGKISRQ
jgi:hypothetical protein